MSNEAIPKLSLTGLTKTQKFWISPKGDITPLRGLWHYQWAKQNQQQHGVDLNGETEEQPVRLRMLSKGWWRVNFDRKPCRLTIEGDIGHLNAQVREAIHGLAETNVSVLNQVKINFLQNGLLAKTVTLDPSTENIESLKLL